MKSHPLLATFVVLFSFVTPQLKANGVANLTSDTGKLCVGAYFFNGWTGKTNHLNKALLDSFPERKPKIGWITSTPLAMQQQIDMAADAGIAFFSFCWYYVNSDSTRFRNHPLNQGVNTFLSAPNQKRMRFNLMVANHAGNIIGPRDWNVVTNAWIEYMINPSYLRVSNKPLIIIFSVKTLVDQFGSTEAVREALDQLRAKARKAGLPGVEIAACIYPKQTDVSMASACGFDVFTAYNYHDAGFNGSSSIPIDNLLAGSKKYWNGFTQYKAPYIPVVTLNWDPRPWKYFNSSYTNSPSYVGYAGSSVYKSVMTVKQWVDTHPANVTAEHVVLLYAWNEYGEGAWLTPSDLKPNLLNGLKQALTGAR